MSSKATAVLLRLREIDKKYKFRHENKSDESDSDNDNKNGGGTILNDTEKRNSGNKSCELFRPQLNIKIPYAHDEYLETNSSTDDDKEHSVVRVVDANESDVKSSISSKESVSSVEETEKVGSDDKIDDSSVNKIDDENYELKANVKTIDGLAVSNTEDLDDITELISEVSENSLNKDLSLETIVENDKSSKVETKTVTSIHSIKSSIEKYSDDSFESSSSEKKKLDVASNVASPPSLLIENFRTTKHIEEVVGVKTGQTSTEDNSLNNSVITNINDTKVINVTHTHTELSVESVINNKSYVSGKTASENSRKQYSVTTNDSVIIEEASNSLEISTLHSKNDISEYHIETIERKYSNGTNIVGDASPTPREHSEKSVHTSIPKTRSKKSSNNYVSKRIDCRIETITEEHQNRRRKNNVQHSKKESSSSKRVLEQKMRRDHVRFRREHERIHSTLLHYLQEMREEKRQLQMIWPKRLICPELTGHNKIIKPLDFPNVANFIRPSDNSVNKHPDPNMDILRNRLLDIRQWLKDQYSIYKEHSSVAAAINKRYNEEVISAKLERA